MHQDAHARLEAQEVLQGNTAPTAAMALLRSFTSVTTAIHVMGGTMSSAPCS